MRDRVAKFRDLTIALAELKPFILNGEHLLTGRPFASFDGGRSRELLANWLLCVSVNSYAGDERLTFTSDPTGGGDGYIVDQVTGESWPTEHVIVPSRGPDTDTAVEDRIVAAIEKKCAKGGVAYASGKTLVVFSDTGRNEPWYPNRIAARIAADCAFEAVWVVALQSANDGHFVYGVARLNNSDMSRNAWIIRLAPDFTAWTVEQIQ